MKIQSRIRKAESVQQGDPWACDYRVMRKKGCVARVMRKKGVLPAKRKYLPLFDDQSRM